MSATAVAAEPVPFRWTTDEYRRMSHLGILHGRRCMLIGGVIWEQHHGDPVNPEPRPVRFSREQYRALAELGFFLGRRVMLIDGEVQQMAAMLEPHAAGISAMADGLRTAFGPGFYVRVQMPLDVNTANDPEPDLVVVPGTWKTYAKSPTAPPASDALLVVEVAAATLTYDTTVKAGLYAEAGISDYWVLDVDNGRLLVFRSPQPVAAGGAAYRTHLTLTVADSVAPLAAPSASINVADLLP